GKAFIIKDEIDQINFEKLTLLNSNNQKAVQDVFINPIEYWKHIDNDMKLRKDFSLSILISLFPIISMFLIVFIGYFNPRYEKNNVSLFSAIAITIFIVSIVLLNKYIPLTSIAIIPLVWVVISYILLKKYVLSRY
ncbi:MAG: permease, partial [Arcobacteraceae bacterium]